MRRLIDADLLMKNCKCTGKFEDNFKCVSMAELKKVIENQPTVFDVEKVVKQIEEESEQSYVDFESYAKEHNIGSGFNDWHYKGLNRAIEIVKQGGRDEE